MCLGDAMLDNMLALQTSDGNRDYGWPRQQKTTEHKTAPAHGKTDEY